MKKKLHSTLLILLLLTSLHITATAIPSHQSNTLHETITLPTPTPQTRAKTEEPPPSHNERFNVFSTLKGWERAFNRLDMDRVVAFFTQDARIKTNIKGELTEVSKQRYKKILDTRVDNWMRDGFQMTLGKPKRLNINGDEAVVIVSTDIDIPAKNRHMTRVSRFRLRKQGTVWLITELGPANK